MLAKVHFESFKDYVNSLNSIKKLIYISIIGKKVKYFLIITSVMFITTEFIIKLKPGLSRVRVIIKLKSRK